ncbi:ankyrin repeat domain-containing protein [Pasteurella multocida]
MAVVNFYIENGVEISTQDMYGMTPLHYAMRAKCGCGDCLIKCERRS